MNVDVEIDSAEAGIRSTKRDILPNHKDRMRFVIMPVNKSVALDPYSTPQKSRANVNKHC